HALADPLLAQSIEAPHAPRVGNPVMDAVHVHARRGARRPLEPTDELLAEVTGVKAALRDATPERALFIEHPAQHAEILDRDARIASLREGEIIGGGPRPYVIGIAPPDDEGRDEPDDAI